MIDRVTISAGDHSLEGLLERPDEGGVWGGVVLCHPHPLYGGNMHNNVVLRVAPALAHGGLTALRFNFQGVGRSQGRYAEGVGEQGDLRAALAFLAAEDDLENKPLFAVGYSFGAAVVARAACDDPHVAAMICIALPAGRPGFDDFPELRRCGMPKLFLHGASDDLCPASAVRELIGGVPDPKALVVLDATDHFFHSREPELASHILRFLAELRPAA